MTLHASVVTCVLIATFFAFLPAVAMYMLHRLRLWLARRVGYLNVTARQPTPITVHLYYVVALIVVYGVYGITYARMMCQLSGTC